eukprot:9556716-Alexandrium_andersonii.AAC.1
MLRQATEHDGDRTDRTEYIPPWRDPGNAKLLQVFGAGTAWFQERPQNWSPKLPRSAFCTVVRADS